MSPARRRAPLRPLAALLLLLVADALPARASDTEADSSDELGRLAFLVGQWCGEALGGRTRELWTAAEGDAMHGIFRLVVDGKLHFAEFLQITAEEEGPMLRFAHFRPDYSTWEGEGPPMELRLAEAGDRYAHFVAVNESSPDIRYRLTVEGILEVSVTGLDEPLRFQRLRA